MGPTAKTLILDLLSTQSSAPEDAGMPVAALVAAGDLMGLEANNIRVTLARLLAHRLVARDERGRYRLGRAAAAVAERVGGWRQMQDRLLPWAGGWVAVHRRRGAGSRRSRTARRGEQALRLLGFEALEPGLAVRPDNLRGGVPGLRDQLALLGLEAGALVAGLADLDPVSERRARQLWDAEAILADYERSRRALRTSRETIVRLGNDAAMIETFRIGGRVLRQIVLDPLLPEPIVAAAPRQALLEDMREYDRLGRSQWAAFLAGFGVAHRRTPLDIRVALEPELGTHAATRGQATES